MDAMEMFGSTQEPHYSNLLHCSVPHKYLPKRSFDKLMIKHGLSSNDELQLCSKVYIPLAKTVLFLVFKVKKLKMGQSVTGTNGMQLNAPIGQWSKTNRQIIP